MKPLSLLAYRVYATIQIKGETCWFWTESYATASVMMQRESPVPVGEYAGYTHGDERKDLITSREEYKGAWHGTKAFFLMVTFGT